MVSVSNHNPAVPGSSPALAGDFLDLFSDVPSSNPRPPLQIANWLPPTSWGFNPVILYLNYLFLGI